MIAENFIVWRMVLRCRLVLLPSLLMALIIQDVLWVHASIMAVSILIGTETASLTPLGMLLQAVLAISGFVWLYFSLQWPPIFVLSCMLLACGCTGPHFLDTVLRSGGGLSVVRLTGFQG